MDVVFFSRCRTLKKISPFFLWSTILAQRCCQCHDVDFHGFRGNLCKTQETYVDGPPVDQDGPRIALATNLLISYPIVFFWSLYIYIFIFIYIYIHPQTVSTFVYVIHQPLIPPAVWDELACTGNVRCAQETWLTNIDKQAALFS